MIKNCLIVTSLHLNLVNYAKINNNNNKIENFFYFQSIKF